MNQLHPGARWLFRLRVYRPLLSFGIFIVFFWWVVIVAAQESYWSYVNIGILFIPLLLIFLIVGEVYARMSYKRWLYEFKDEYINIEHGIIWKKYISLPYEKVQNVDIKRGIIARLAGFSSVEIETAGQSSFGGGGFKFKIKRRGGRVNQYHSEGYLPAVDLTGAEKIREFVMKKIKQTNRDKQGI